MKVISEDARKAFESAPKIELVLRVQGQDAVVHEVRVDYFELDSDRQVQEVPFNGSSFVEVRPDPFTSVVLRGRIYDKEPKVSEGAAFKTWFKGMTEK